MCLQSTLAPKMENLTSTLLGSRFDFTSVQCFCTCWKIKDKRYHPWKATKSRSSSQEGQDPAFRDIFVSRVFKQPFCSTLFFCFWLFVFHRPSTQGSWKASARKAVTILSIFSVSVSLCFSLFVSVSLSLSMIYFLHSWSNFMAYDLNDTVRVKGAVLINSLYLFTSLRIFSFCHSSIPPCAQHHGQHPAAKGMNEKEPHEKPAWWAWVS